MSLLCPNDPDVLRKAWDLSALYVEMEEPPAEAGTRHPLRLCAEQ